MRKWWLAVVASVVLCGCCVHVRSAEVSIEDALKGIATLLGVDPTGKSVQEFLNACQSARVPQAPASVAVSSIPWVRWFKADAITGLSDGDAVASWVDSSANADPAVQATSNQQPIYKTNIINGKPAVKFDGSNDFLRTTAGGASLTGSYYMAAVFQPTAINHYQHVLCFGDDSASLRRGMLVWTSGTAFANTLTFNSCGGVDVQPTITVPLVVGTPVLLEIFSAGTRSASTVVITLAQDGVPLFSGGTTYGAYSNNTLTLGANNSGTENIYGYLAEAMFLGSNPTADQLAAIRGYLRTKYAMSIDTSSAALTLSGVATHYSDIRDVSGVTSIQRQVVIGGTTPAKTGRGASAAPTSWASVLSVYGAVVADAGATGDHLLATNSTDNVLALWNKNKFSALRCLVAADGKEGCAFGYAQTNSAPFSASDAGGTYLECSNFSDPTKGGRFRLVQTADWGSGVTNKVRWEWTTSGDCIWYDMSGNQILNISPNGTPGASPAAGFTLYIDAGDGNKLKVKGSAGTVTTLAVP